jgi:hypothetical protein
MHTGEQFTFLCAPKMAEGMDKPITLAYGTIVERDIRSFGVIITVKKDNTPR